MSTTHTVKQGEHLSTIADNFGFYDHLTIWNDPGNEKLKAQRKNPNVLFPGDKVFIPDKQQKGLICETTELHRFQVRMQKLELRLVVRDVNGNPLPNTKCHLDVDGEISELVTNAKGQVIKKISRQAQQGQLSVGEQRYTILIGYLDPITEPSGWRGRLANLGYYLGSGDDVDEEELKSAIEEFQCDYGLHVDGVMGRNSQAKLKEIYGC
jgi:Putative peptidoglycan binding domain/LysM domain